MLAAALLLTGCADLMETGSELVEYEKDNHLDSPSDSVYSVMGIIYKLQTLLTVRSSWVRCVVT